MEPFRATLKSMLVAAAVWVIGLPCLYAVVYLAVYQEWPRW